MSGSAAAIWSAIAATSSAIAAIVMARIQRQNTLEASRPDLILTGWERKIKQQGDHKYDIISFNKIRNIGKGTAQHIIINATKFIDDKLLASLSTVTISILSANEEREINGEIHLNWDHEPTYGKEGKYIQIDIEIHSWCSRGYLHETIYNFFVDNQIKNISFLGGEEDEIAPGVMLSARKTIRKPLWRIKLNRRLSRIPIIGKCFHNKYPAHAIYG